MLTYFLVYRLQSGSGYPIKILFRCLLNEPVHKVLFRLALTKEDYLLKNVDDFLKIVM